MIATLCEKVLRYGGKWIPDIQHESDKAHTKLRGNTQHMDIVEQYKETRRTRRPSTLTAEGENAAGERGARLYVFAW